MFSNWALIAGKATKKTSFLCGEVWNDRALRVDRSADDNSLSGLREGDLRGENVRWRVVVGVMGEICDSFESTIAFRVIEWCTPVLSPWRGTRLALFVDRDRRQDSGRPTVVCNRTRFITVASPASGQSSGISGQSVVACLCRHSVTYLG